MSTELRIIMHTQITQNLLDLGNFCAEAIHDIDRSFPASLASRFVL